MNGFVVEPINFKKMNDEIEEVRAMYFKGIGDAKDRIFLDALSKHGFVFESKKEIFEFLSGKAKAIKNPEHTTYFVDGIPFLRIWDNVIEHSADCSIISFEYKIFKKPIKSK